jgi:hypothetical protein
MVCTYHKFSWHIYFPRPHLCTTHISTVQMILPKSMVEKSFRTPPPPPTVLPLTEVGGSRITDNACAHLDDPSFDAKIYGLYWIPDPPIRSAFNGGGGGLKCVIKIVHRYVVERKVRRSMAQGVFWTPVIDLPLMVGGRSGMESYSGGPPIYTWHESTGPESHRLLLSDIPRHL